MIKHLSLGFVNACDDGIAYGCYGFIGFGVLFEVYGLTDMQVDRVACYELRFAVHGFVASGEGDWDDGQPEV